MESGHSLPQVNLSVQGGTHGASHKWVRKSCGLNHECRGTGEKFPSPSDPYLNGRGGDRWHRPLSSLRGISPS
ncbi:hypothetical protein TNCV_3845991 [Trichonephila clavipes]|nr:hypothetical protein TNCV_3845991 [Trichonephila clavipes]